METTTQEQKLTHQPLLEPDCMEYKGGGLNELEQVAFLQSLDECLASIPESYIEEPKPKTKSPEEERRTQVARAILAALLNNMD